MSRAVLIFIFSFFSVVLHAQSETASTRQNITMQLHDISILEKKNAVSGQSHSNNNNPLEIQSAGKWIITTADVRTIPNNDELNTGKKNPLTFNTQHKEAELVYTLSKA